MDEQSRGDRSAGEPVIVTVFRSRRRHQDPDEYGRTMDRMTTLARSLPGLRELEQYAADGGERLSLIVFESRAAHDAWRDHPEHREARHRGRDRSTSGTRSLVCELVDHRSFARDP